jgi:hypothetical protein
VNGKLPRVFGLAGAGALAVAATGCTEPSGARLDRSSTNERLFVHADALIWAGGQKLAASDAAELDEFGYSVSLTESHALIGAYAENDFRGAAYVFVRSGGSWLEEQKLVASDGVPGDNLGCSVWLAADRAIVGANAID